MYVRDILKGGKQRKKILMENDHKNPIYVNKVMMLFTSMSFKAFSLCVENIKILSSSSFFVLFPPFFLPRLVDFIFGFYGCILFSKCFDGHV